MELFIPSQCVERGLFVGQKMPPKAEPKKGGKAGEVEPVIDVAKAMKDLRPRWERLSATVGVPLESKVCS